MEKYSLREMLQDEITMEQLELQGALRNRVEISPLQRKLENALNSDKPERSDRQDPE